MVAAHIDNEKRPSCAIIGAGIAGLSASIALRRAGWDVEVRRTYSNSSSGSLTFTPRSMRRLI